MFHCVYRIRDLAAQRSPEIHGVFKESIGDATNVATNPKMPPDEPTRRKDYLERGKEGRKSAGRRGREVGCDSEGCIKEDGMRTPAS